MKSQSPRLLWLFFVLNIGLLQVLAHPSIRDILGQPLQFDKRFESAEHKSIGDSVRLAYPTYNISGSFFAYVIGKNILSFGDIIALAGDFYANWSNFNTGCLEQVSDNYDTNPNASIAIFNMISNYLQTDNGGYLTCVLEVQRAQAQAVQTGIANGQDPAQVYANISSSFDQQYALCTAGYAWIALCNFDHFGQDAVRTYKAGHTAALNQAINANRTGNTTLLTGAYFLEAFAQHYLTDLFAGGHTREPRRILHWTYIDGDVGLPSPYPADRCAQKQHDEENANGLWVTNAIGESWASYGDKELFSNKSTPNFGQAVKACQAGVAEIYGAFRTGTAPSTANYAALNIAPILSGLNTGDNNFAPMFLWNASDPNNLYLRTNIDQRYNGKLNAPYTQYSNPPSLLTWQNILGNISASQEDQNIHPFTQSFQSPNQVIHVREGKNTNLVVNMYGGFPTAATSWNMLSQTELAVSNVSGPTKWVSMNSNTLNNGVYILVGRTTSPSGIGYARHIAINASTRFGNPRPDPATLLWEDNIADNNVQWTEGGTALGMFSQNGTSPSTTVDFGLVKYFTNGPSNASKLELWTIPNNLTSKAVFSGSSFGVGKINFIFSIPSAFWPSVDTFIATGYNPQFSGNVWYFITWTNNYKTAFPSTYFDATLTYPAQALLIGQYSRPGLIRLSYGPTFPIANAIQIDFLTINVNTSGGSVSLVNRQTFPITWPTLLPSQYLTWNMTDVNLDGISDLVGYTSDSSNTTFKSIVFPGIGGGKFSAPIVSNLTVPPANTSFFAGGFMKPIITRGVSSRYRYGINYVNNAGFLSFFDNFGILGARMAAPTAFSGSYNMSIVGQTPGIAGQSSMGLGLSPVDVMGTGGPPEMLGFATVPNN